MYPNTEKEIKDMSQVHYCGTVWIFNICYDMYSPRNCYVVSLVRRYQSNHWRDHWKAVKRTFKYLTGTVDHTMVYSGSDLCIRGYTNVKWASERDDRKSTSGYAFLLTGGGVSWKNKKKTCVALSIMEYELLAFVSEVGEVGLLKIFFEHLSIAKNYKGPMILCCDSQEASRTQRNFSITLTSCIM